MTFSLALAETPREILIDGDLYVLVRRSALDALFPGRPVDRATQRPDMRPAGVTRSQPSKTKLKTRSQLPAARPSATPSQEAAKPVNGALRGAVLAEIQASPGQTSLELFDVISKRIPTTTSGSVYQSAKALVRDGLVRGQQTDEGTIGWHPVAAPRA